MSRLQITLLLFAILSIQLNGQIIADHRIVDQYESIPQNWIDSVKTMLVNIAGMSHAIGYHTGVELLEELDPRYQVTTFTSEPIPGPTDQYLRLGRPYMAGTENFYESPSAIESWKNIHLNYSGSSNPYNVQAFGWSYQTTWQNPPGGLVDPFHNVRWAGSSEGGLDGNKVWGLDKDDSILTGNRVCMDTYLDAMEQYIQYCIENDISTVMLFTNGEVDSNDGTEGAFQRELKNQHIRDYVEGKQGIYFFDYADILVHNNSGELHTVNWNDGGSLRPHQQIHPDNMMDYDASFNIIPPQADIMEDHIGEVGALRIGKAMWWLLARIAGWEGTGDGEDTSPPSAPSGIALQNVSESSVSFSWTASNDNVAVTMYQIYRDGLLLNSTSQLSFTDNTVEPCIEYVYTITAMDAAGNESPPSQELTVSTCAPDLAPTLIVTPNISHGVTTFDVIVRVTELNSINTNGTITIQIPKDGRWVFDGTYDPELKILDGMPLDNNNWSYSSDASFHIFTSTAAIPAGGFSTFGFSISFNPDTNRGLYTITSQLVSGSGGETRYTNNADSERLDYFQ